MTACDCCINAPYCEHRGMCDLEAGCDDFVEVSHEPDRGRGPA